MDSYINDIASLGIESAKGKNLPLVGKNTSAAEIDQAAIDFEAVFLSQMLDLMFKDVKFNPMSDGGFAEDTYKSMLLDEYSKAFSAAGGIGIAKEVREELMRLQEVQNGTDKSNRVTTG